jgi:hypothetical protein
MDGPALITAIFGHIDKIHHAVHAQLSLQSLSFGHFEGYMHINHLICSPGCVSRRAAISRPALRGSFITLHSSDRFASRGPARSLSQKYMLWT